MATEKIVNYTPEQTAMLVSTYTAEPSAATVEVLAAKLGRSVRSIVAKLAMEHVYQPGKRVAKRQVLKSEMVERIAKLTKRSVAEVESLEKATGPALMVILKELEYLNEQILMLNKQIYELSDNGN